MIEQINVIERGTKRNKEPKRKADEVKWQQTTQKQWPDMPHRDSSLFCCCQLLLIHHGVCLIAFHCLLQAACGAGVVLTSAYKPQYSLVNYTTIASNLCLIPTGILVFWANVYESWKGAKAASIFTIVVTLFNLATTIAYFWTYADFKANSLLDQDFFWNDKNDWIGSEDFPFTLWHVLVIFLILVSGLWFYYAFVMWQYSKVLKKNKA